MGKKERGTKRKSFGRCFDDWLLFLHTFFDSEAKCLYKTYTYETVKQHLFNFFTRSPQSSKSARTSNANIGETCSSTVVITCRKPLGIYAAARRCKICTFEKDCKVFRALMKYARGTTIPIYTWVSDAGFHTRMQLQVVCIQKNSVIAGRI